MRTRPSPRARAALAWVAAALPATTAAVPLREYPAIAMGEEGSVVAWVERSPGRAEVMAAWTSVEAPALSVSGPAIRDERVRPSVALRGARAVVAWADASRGDYDVWAALSDDGGRSFAPPVLVAGGAGGQIDPRAVVLPGGRIAVAFHDSFGATAADEGLVWRARAVVSDGAGRFGPSVVLGGPASSERFDLYAALAGQGTPESPLVVAWLREATNGTSTEVLLAQSLDGGDSFGPPARIDRPLGRHLYPRVASTSRGWIAAFASLLPAGDVQRVAGLVLDEPAYLDVLAVTSSTAGSSFGPPALTPASGALSQHQVDVAADGGRVALVWVDHPRPDQRRLAYAWSRDGGQSFEPAREVPGTLGLEVAHPSVAVRGEVGRVVFEVPAGGGVDVRVAALE